MLDALLLSCPLLVSPTEKTYQPTCLLGAAASDDEVDVALSITDEMDRPYSVTNNQNERLP